MKVIEILRQAVVNWANGVNDSREFEGLPPHVFGFVQKESKPAHSVVEAVTEHSGKKSKRRRVRKHKAKNLTDDQKKHIREVMSGLKTGSPEYTSAMKKIALEYGASPRQIAAVVTGLERAAKRLKKQKKK